MIKKRKLLVTMASAAALFLAACGAEADTTEDTAASNEEVETVETDGELTGDIEFMTIALLPTFEEYLNKSS